MRVIGETALVNKLPNKALVSKSLWAWVFEYHVLRQVSSFKFQVDRWIRDAMLRWPISALQIPN